MFTTSGPRNADSRTAGPSPRQGSVMSGRPPSTGPAAADGHGSRPAAATSSGRWGPGCTVGPGPALPDEPVHATVVISARVTSSTDGADLTALPRPGSAT